MFCDQCGRKLGPEAKFCSSCSAAVVERESVAGEDANAQSPVNNRMDESCGDHEVYLGPTLVQLFFVYLPLLVFILWFAEQVLQSSFLMQAALWILIPIWVYFLYRAIMNDE